MGIPHWVSFCQVDSIIHRGNVHLSSASLNKPRREQGFFYVSLFLPFFYSPPPLLLFFSRRSAWGGDKALGYVFRGLCETLSRSVLSVISLLVVVISASSSSSPVVVKSSLLHQQHGESRREKENNRGNGARDDGFKPPLTTDKQHRPKSLKERRKPPNVGHWSGFRGRKMDSRVYLDVKCEFCCYPGLCFSTVGSPRAPWNGLSPLIGRPGGGGVVKAFLPVPHAPQRTHSTAAARITSHHIVCQRFINN